jgi:excisionase family DNA binding protein
MREAADILTTAEATDRLRVSTKSLALVRGGSLRGTKVRRARRFPRTDLFAYVHAGAPQQCERPGAVA